MYCKIDDFLVLHFSGRQIIWDTTTACDLLKKSKKSCIPVLHFKYFFDLQKTSDFLKMLFCFWTSQPQNVIVLRWTFFWQANDSRSNGWVWFSYTLLINFTPVTSSNHLPAKKNVDMEFIYFWTNFSLVIVIKKITWKKSPWLVSQI